MIVNGDKTSVWHNLWCGSQPLIEIPKVVKYLETDEEANTSEIIINGESNSIVKDIPEGDTRAKVLQVKINSFLNEDHMCGHRLHHGYSQAPIHIKVYLP